jgi:subtilisin family serine protease
MGKVQGLREIYHDDQMVVALSDERLVGQSLADLQIEGRVIDRHEALGLALLELDPTSMTQAVQGLLGGANSQILSGLTRYQQDRAAELGRSVTPLELLLKALRLSFAKEYPNWEGPRIGKNRGIDTLSGAPEIGPGGVGDPLSSQTQLPDRFPQPASASGSAGQGVLVGQLDGPIYPHPWLAGGYIAAPADLVRYGGAYRANEGHAASVASCILALAPAAQIHLRRVLGEDGSGDAWVAAKQMVELTDAGCDVVNVSVGQCFCDDGNPPLTLDTAVRLLSARSVIIAAAGNQGNTQQGSCQAMPDLTPNSVYYPAGCRGAIAVGALDQDGKVSDFTPKDAPYIRLMASGEGVTVAYLAGQVTIEHRCQNTVNTSPFPGWATVSGTSYSAAIVTGEIARRTIPGQVTAREALDQLLAANTPITVPNPQGGIIRPN